ncbi:MAG: tetratricopeptide repeat protein [Acutalibacteraceae bacterium]
MDFDEIMKTITSGLTGNSKEDIIYLEGQMEKYKDHELAKEIIRACGRLIYDLLSADDKQEIEKMISNDAKGTEAVLEEIRFNIFEGNMDKAYSLSKALVDKVENSEMFQNDSVSEYFVFNNPFEEVLYSFYNQSEKDRRRAGIPYSDIYFIYGNILFEMERIDEARKYLKKALRWNPASCTIAFEYIETFKVKNEMDKFFELTKEQFKYAYRPKDVARCYRNLGYYFIEKKEYSVATGCYMLSMIYEKDNQQAQSELNYIKSKAPVNCEEPDWNMLEEYSKKYNFPIGPCDDVIGLSYAYSKNSLEEGNYEWAVYFLDIFCGLTQDKEACELLEKLKAKLPKEDE